MAGFFNKSLTPAGASVSPLSHDRVKAALDADGMNYGVDDDGDIGGWWDGHLFFFFLMGPDKEILQVRGRWNRTIPNSEYETVLELANETHSRRLFPRIAVYREDDGVGIYAHHNVDYEHGVTDEQLRLHFATAISSALAFFEMLDERYPEAAAAAKAEAESESESES